MDSRNKESLQPLTIMKKALQGIKSQQTIHQKMKDGFKREWDTWGKPKKTQ